MYLHARGRRHVHAHARTHSHTHARTHTDPQMRKLTPTPTCARTHTYTCMPMYTYGVYTYVHIYTYVHDVHAYIHMQMWSEQSGSSYLDIFVFLYQHTPVRGSLFSQRITCRPRLISLGKNKQCKQYKKCKYVMHLYMKIISYDMKLIVNDFGAENINWSQ